MLIPDAKGDVLIYCDSLYRLFVGPIRDNVDIVSYRVEDCDGNDITSQVHVSRVIKSAERQWLEVSVNSVGYDGLFCTFDPLDKPRFVLQSYERFSRMNSLA